MSHTSWSQAWLDALLAFSHPGRMRRGRHFAQDGKIKHEVIKPGEVHAQVKDGRKLFDVDIHFPPIDNDTWEKIIDKLAREAIYSARLLSGEIPPEVMEVFEETGVQLFPSANKLEASCTCPDWEVPCKHIAGVYYHLAKQFEKDPFLLFYLRGKSREDLLDALRSYRIASHPESQQTSVSTYEDVPLEQTLDHFWKAGPQLSHIPANISPPSLPAPHFKRLGPPPFTEIDLYALLKPVYDTVTEKILHWAYTKPDNHHV